MNSFGLKEACWVVCDPRVGIVNQCVGLAEAVGLPVEVKIVEPRAPWTWLPLTAWPRPFESLPPGGPTFAPPWPRLTIDCGWRSIPFVLAVKRLSAGKTFAVHIQKPRVALRHFDLVIPPEHDQVVGPNVITTVGAPNGVTRAKLEAAAAQWAPTFQHLKHPRVGVLIGGNSNAHQFDERVAEQFAARLKQLANDGFSLIVTPSRRTGEGQTRIIKQTLEGTSSFVWDGTGDNPYFAILALCDAFLVTGDSTNLLTEPASTGRPIHIIDLPGGTAKFDRLHANLIARGIARHFSGKIETWSYPPLEETSHIAAEINRRMNARAG